MARMFLPRYVVLCSVACPVHYILQRIMDLQKDWNNHSPAVVEKEGNKAHPVDIYCTSKGMRVTHRQ